MAPGQFKSPDSQRAKQIAKHKGLECCVCGKWGASTSRPLDGWEDIDVIKATHLSLTLKKPLSPAAHDKCLKQMRALILQKETEREK